MIELQRKISLKKYREQIGRKVEVYIESFSKSRKNGFRENRDFKTAVLTGTEDDFGTLKQIEVKDATASTLICF